MKKLFGILVLGLLWCNTSFAGCGEDIEGSWKYTGGKSFVKYTFKNTSSNSIVITRVGLQTVNKETVVESKKEVYVKPFGVKSTEFYVGDINLDVVDTGFRSCRYGTKSTTETSNPPKKKKSGAKKLLEKIIGD